MNEKYVVLLGQKTIWSCGTFLPEDHKVICQDAAGFEHQDFPGLIEAKHFTCFRTYVLSSTLAN